MDSNKWNFFLITKVENDSATLSETIEHANIVELKKIEDETSASRSPFELEYNNCNRSGPKILYKYMKNYECFYFAILCSNKN